MASSSPKESPNSTLRRRARRRLVGSIALVLAAVIALPMIFDEEKKPLEQDIQVRIPSQETVTVRSQTGAANTSKIVEPKVPAPEALAEPAVEGKASSSAPSRDAPVAAAKHDPGERQAALGDAKSGSKPVDKPANGSAAKAGPQAGEEVRVKSILDDKRSSTVVVGGGFAVQVGAFSDEDKVREAQGKLAHAGFKSYTEKLASGNGERTRVRAGPFASREAADTARDKIRTIGFAGASVVAH